MNLTYATFDTLTIDAEMARSGLATSPPPPSAPAKRSPAASSTPHAAPLLARLPRLATAASATLPTPPRERVDSAAMRLVGAHTTPSPGVGTFAIDTQSAVAMAPGTRGAEPATISALPVAPDAKSATRSAPRDEMTELLLGWDAAIAPYVRWIVLAALFAALGLTLVLLRGGDSSSLGDAPAISPRAAIASPAEIAAPSAPQAGIVSAAAAPWGATTTKPMPTTGELASIAGERPTSATVEGRPLRVALGPIAAPPRAVLEQRVLEPLATKLGAEPTAARVANLPSLDGESSAASSFSGPYPSTSVPPGSMR